MSLITPYLYLGDINDAENLNFLASKKVSLIVNTAKEIPNFYPKNFKYLNLHLKDVPRQDIIDALQISSEEILKNMKNGKVVFVHCAAGVSRSSSVVIYTLMRLHKWDYEKSFKYVKSMRDIINPNPGFVEQLIMMGNGLNDSIKSADKIESFVNYEEENSELPEDSNDVINPKESSLHNRSHKSTYARIFA